MVRCQTMTRLFLCSPWHTLLASETALCRENGVDLATCTVLSVIQHLRPIVTKEESAVSETTTDLWEGGFLDKHI